MKEALAIALGVSLWAVSCFYMWTIMGAAIGVSGSFLVGYGLVTLIHGGAS